MKTHKISKFPVIWLVELEDHMTFEWDSERFGLSHNSVINRNDNNSA